MNQKNQKQNLKTKKSSTKSLKPQQIFDTNNSTCIGISLWTDEALQAITKQSGKHAKKNEYQIHYWAVNLRFTGTDDSVLDLSIPSVIFNYKQEVSLAHIDFELTDVDEMSEALEVLQKIEVNKLVPLVEKLKNLLPNMKTEIKSVNLNQLHRHPGSRQQFFSGTDYNKNPNADTGIIFPLADAKNQANFASIIAHDKGKTFLAHTEYRRATGIIKKDTDKIQYEKGRCVSYVKVPSTQPSLTEQLFGYEKEELSYTISDNLNIDNTTILNNLIYWWDSLEYQPNTQFIKSEHISLKKQTPVVTTSKHTKKISNNEEIEEIFDINSEESLTQITEYAKKNYKLELPPFENLENLTQKNRNTLYYKLEHFIYNIDFTEYVEYTGANLFYDNVSDTDLIELYIDVINELAAEIQQVSWEDEITVLNEYDYMRQELIKIGADAIVINSASKTKIDEWFKELIAPN